MKPKSNYIPPEQMKLLIESIPRLQIRKWKDQDVVMLFLICYWCNLRIGEGLRLQAEDFDLSVYEVYLGRTKANKEDYATIPKQFEPELSLWLHDKKGFLFPGMNRPIVYNWLKRLGKMLNIPALTTSQEITGEKTVTHIFRKSMGKDMLYGTNQKKAPITVISKHLRHKGRNPIASTYQYLKLDIADVKEHFETTEQSKDQIEF